jgi:hypothetical protein
VGILWSAPIVLEIIGFIKGEQLESIHLSRQRAQIAHDLIDYYFLFAKNDTTKLDELRKEGREGRQQVAIILRRLRAVATEVDIPSAEKVGFLVPASRRQKLMIRARRRRT